TPAEKALAKVWAQVLGTESIGVHDNFFDAGGTSLQTVEVVSLARQAGLMLSPEMVFRHQTIAELAAAVGRACVADDPPAETVVPGVALNGAAHAKTAVAGALIESMGVYLPRRTLTTEEVMRGCSVPLDFPLERFTGIRSRRIAEEGEYSID